MLNTVLDLIGGGHKKVKVMMLSGCVSEIVGCLKKKSVTLSHQSKKKKKTSSDNNKSEAESKSLDCLAVSRANKEV